MSTKFGNFAYQLVMNDLKIFEFQSGNDKKTQSMCIYDREKKQH